MERAGDAAEFVKRGEPDEIALERVKTIRAGEIGTRTGLFRVPRVLDSEDEPGILVLERIAGFRRLADLAPEDDARSRGVFELLGRSMAVVHKELALPEQLVHSLPPEWMDEAGHNVFVHGDLTVRNAGWDTESGGLVIVDWAVAHDMAIDGTFGSPYFDLVWLVMSAFWTKPLLRRPLYSPRSLCDAFIRGYSDSSPDFSVERLGELATTSRCWREDYWTRSDRRIWGDKARYRLWARYARRLGHGP